MSEAKTGSEIVKDFFESIAKREDLDKDVVDVLTKLYEQKKITSTNISNELEAVRKKALSGNT